MLERYRAKKMIRVNWKMLRLYACSDCPDKDKCEFVNGGGAWYEERVIEKFGDLESTRERRDQRYCVKLLLQIKEREYELLDRDKRKRRTL